MHFYKAQFNYCPAILMFHSRTLNNKISRLHERCLRMIYNNKISNIKELLHRDNSVSMHQNNINALAVETYKVVNCMSPEIINEVFKQRDNPHYNLKHILQISLDPIPSVYNRTESTSYLERKIWEQIHSGIQNKKTLEGFKWENKK